MVDDIEIGSSVDIEDNLQKESLTIYPNPAKDKIYIDFCDFKSTDLSIEICNIMGKTLRKYKTEGNIPGTFVANIAGLDPGIYLLKINGSPGKITKKLIIEK